nr:RNA-directed DNA polymerase, eukaryota [Tanacetum cinerariifolium]
MLLDDECLNTKDLSCSLMGRVKEFTSLSNLKKVLCNEGFDVLKISYLVYWMRAKEVPGWTPEFIEEEEEDDASVEDNHGGIHSDQEINNWNLNKGHLDGGCAKKVNEVVAGDDNSFVHTVGGKEYSGSVNKMSHSMGLCRLKKLGMPRIKLMIVVVYAPQEASEKHMLWDYLTHVSDQWDGEIVMMGDFNEVRYKSERFGSNFKAHDVDIFNSFLHNAGLNEVHLGGSAFTWCHKSATKMRNLNEGHLDGGCAKKVNEVVAGDDNSFVHNVGGKENSGPVNKMSDSMGSCRLKKPGMPPNYLHESYHRRHRESSHCHFTVISFFGEIKLSGELQVHGELLTEDGDYEETRDTWNDVINGSGKKEKSTDVRDKNDKVVDVTDEFPILEETLNITQSTEYDAIDAEREVDILKDDIVIEESEKLMISVCGHFVGYKMSYPEDIILEEFEASRVGYARVVVEVNAEKEFKRLVEVCYKCGDNGNKCSKFVDVEYSWKLHTCSHRQVFRHVETKESKRNNFIANKNREKRDAQRNYGIMNKGQNKPKVRCEFTPKEKEVIKEDTRKTQDQPNKNKESIEDVEVFDGTKKSDYEIGDKFVKYQRQPIMKESEHKSSKMFKSAYFDYNPLDDPSPQYGSPYQSSQYSNNQSSTPFSITYPSNDYQSSVHHNVYSPSSSITQLEYAPTVNQQQQQPKFLQLDSGLTVPVFKQGDDPIDAINHMIVILISCRPTLQQLVEAILGNKGLLFVTTAKGKDTCPNSAPNLKGNEMNLGLRTTQANGQILHEEELAFSQIQELQKEQRLIIAALKDELRKIKRKALVDNHSKLNANSELICFKCNDCMLSDNHDLCVPNVINDVNASSKSKFAFKHSKRKVWKPTGKVFTKIRYTWRPTGRTFTIVGNACPLTRITTPTEVPPRKPTVLKNDAPKHVVTLVYSRKPRKSKTNVLVSKPKIIKSVSANNKEPSKS